MNKTELIWFSICVVLAVITSFDFIVYTLKSAPKQSILYRWVWMLGLGAITALVYWFMNGYKFL
jgi:hypothetical protein